MSETVKSRLGCEAFRDDLPPLTPGVIHRFVVGEDEELRAYGPGQAEAELGDPFATLLLLRGVFPTTAGDVLRELGRAAPAGEPLANRMFFFVGENSPIGDPVR